jgi:hypothetical protein
LTVKELISKLKKLPLEAEIKIIIDSINAKFSIDEVLYIDHETIHVISYDQ